MDVFLKVLGSLMDVKKIWDEIERDDKIDQQLALAEFARRLDETEHAELAKLIRQNGSHFGELETTLNLSHDVLSAKLAGINTVLVSIVQGIEELKNMPTAFGLTGLTAQQLAILSWMANEGQSVYYHLDGLGLHYREGRQFLASNPPVGFPAKQIPTLLGDLKFLAEEGYITWDKPAGDDRAELSLHDKGLQVALRDS